jgi:tetratricopeptide (TPR) repeat protein
MDRSRPPRGQSLVIPVFFLKVANCRNPDRGRGRRSRIRYALLVALAAGSLTGLCAGARVDPEMAALAQRRWLATRTAPFNIYSCGPPQEVYPLAGRLEQFCEAYTLLAGARAIASPPIVVMAFPDPESMQSFVPLYRGKPERVAGFFNRGSDENLIVLALPSTNSGFSDLQVIFHEYAHLLFRHNGLIWPLWLKEGMAEVYSTFQTTGRTAFIAQPSGPHLRLLGQHPLMPLSELFAVTPDSPQYNERERQGIFYAESWLLTHFLIAGDVPAYRTRFERFTALLRAGQYPEQAFTNALGAPLPVMEAQLRRYLRQGRFAPIRLSLPADVSSPKALRTRALTPVETWFRLGDELLRIDRLEAAEACFRRAQELAPASRLPWEGLGLLAARRDEPEQALRELSAAAQRGSISFLAHYTIAREKYRLTADAEARYAPLQKEPAARIRAELEKSLALMPDFGPAHELLGFFEMVQGENLALAEQHLERAIQLEPENPSYLISLAQLQLRQRETQAARRTLEPLLLPTADPKLRAHAEGMIQQMGRENPRP